MDDAKLAQVENHRFHVFELRNTEISGEWLIHYKIEEFVKNYQISKPYTVQSICVVSQDQEITKFLVVLRMD